MGPVSRVGETSADAVQRVTPPAWRFGVCPTTNRSRDRQRCQASRA